MSKALLTVSYDGTAYAGWQRQENARSVQQVLEEALSRLLGEEYSTIGGGRTDAGVHALGQKALVREQVIRVPLPNLAAAVNTLLPDDVRVIHTEEVPDNFHPLRNPCVKTYIYSIINAPVMPPVYRHYAAFERRSLCFFSMGEAARHFVGTHDFAGFCSAGSSVATTTRTVSSLDLEKIDDLIKITITGTGFLYNMVRIIAGTLVDVGLLRVQPDDIPGIILSKNRTCAGKTLPAHGLMLCNIDYNVVEGCVRKFRSGNPS